MFFFSYWAISCAISNDVHVTDDDWCFLNPKTENATHIKLEKMSLF